MTETERVLLRHLEAKHHVRGGDDDWVEMSDDESEAADMLLLAGRVKIVGAELWCFITPAGREALRIDAALRAMGVAI